MMPEVARLTVAYESKGVFVDTNLFLLLLVGSADRNLIMSFKRTRQYVPEDFDLLVDFLSRFRLLVTTPSVLTEVSNLAGQLGEASRAPVFLKFSAIIARHLKEFRESKVIAEQRGFVRFGLTDASIVSIVKDRFLLLTDDFRLAQYYAHTGGDVINFNHIRVLAWQS